MNPRWVALAFFLGMAVSAGVFQFVTRSRSADGSGPIDSAAPASPGSSWFEEMSERLRTVEDVVARIDARLEAHLDLGKVDWDGATARVSEELPLDPARPTSAEEKAESFRHSWPSVLDREVARTLVERGLTPYDAGVPSYLVRTCSRLREVESNFERASERERIEAGIGEMVNTGNALHRQYEINLKNLLEEYKTARARILEDLGLALESVPAR